MNKEDVVQVKEELADLGVELDKTKKDAFSECFTLFVEEHPLVEVVEMAELKVLEVERDSRASQGSEPWSLSAVKSQW